MHLFARRLHVWYTAGIVYLALKLTQKRLKASGAADAVADAAWARTHTWCAKRLVQMAIARGALWLKFGQYLASRADVLPEPYIKELDSCLDAAKPLAPSDVEDVLRAELPRPVDELFDGFDAATPIASASIAQVHRCRLRGGEREGGEVVLKIQRPEVKQLLLQDLDDLDRILTLVAGSEPDFDFRPMLSAWMEMVPLECDFLHEMKNSAYVRGVLDDARGTQFETKSFVPEILPEFTTERVMCVRFIDGCSIRDIEVLDEHDIDRDDLVAEISKAFALQIHRLGKWSGDPHSGNIIVELKSAKGNEGKSARPGLIDFGITVTLSEKQRLGFCRTVVAAAESDSFSLLQSFADMDIVLNRADPTASLDTIRHLFRSTASREDTLKQSREFMERAKARDEANLDSGIAVDRRGEAEKGSQLEKSKRENGPRRFISKLFGRKKNEEGGKQVQVPTESSAGRRSPVDAYPGFLVFLFRTLGLLRGLSTRLGVEHTYLPIMYDIAVSALHDSVPADERAKSLVYEPSGEDAGKVAKSLRTRKAKRLKRILTRVAEELHKRKLFVGCQVAVFHKGEIVLDLAAGTIGKHNIRPVLPSSLFCPFSATKGVCAILAAELADEYGIQPSDLVSKWWPAYGCKGKEATTVGMLLSHRAGLAQAAPDDMRMNRLCDDWQGIIDWLATEATPSHPPGEKVVYHALNFGWLVAGLLQNVSGGESIQDRLGTLAAKIGIDDECYIGLPKHMCADVASSRIAVLSNEIYNDINRFMKTQVRAKEGSGNPVGAAGVSVLDPKDSSSQQGENVDALYEGGDTGAMKGAKLMFEKLLTQDGSITNPDSSPDCVSPSATSSLNGDEGKLDSDKDDNDQPNLSEFLAKTPYLVEPTYFSHPVMRQAVIPAANGHFTARALAKLYSALAQDGMVDGKRILQKGRTAKMMETEESEMEEDSFGAGMRLYKCMDRRGRPVNSKAIGHQGIGGSVAFAIPDHDFALAFTCNQLNAFSAAGAVLISAVCAILNVPAPEAYAGLLHKLRVEGVSEDTDVEALFANMDGEVEKAVTEFSVLRALTG